MPKGIYKRKFDKNSIQYLKYRDIALEFIKQGYNNIRSIYKTHYPKASNKSIDSAPYQLLDNLRFQQAIEEAWQEIKIKDLDIARQAIRTLYHIALNGKKEADRINAAVWLGKTDALFIDRTDSRTEIVIKPEEKAELNHIRGSLLHLISTASEN